MSTLGQKRTSRHVCGMCALPPIAYALALADNINSVVPGFVRNPYNTAFASGGSSGGTGASLAANFGVVGIGSDTGGSLRVPSALNALAGLRPTVGLVSRTGLVPLDSVRDNPGPMARALQIWRSAAHSATRLLPDYAVGGSLS
jgi:Asp-tRNA(Asn)/Glu-tRNA(Gln) amidotransferase A subunit family amidase